MSFLSDSERRIAWIAAEVVAPLATIEYWTGEVSAVIGADAYALLLLIGGIGGLLSLLDKL